MEKALQFLAELRKAGADTHERVTEFLKLCDELKVPRVTLYAPASSSGWHEMFRVYVFTKRADLTSHIWYLSLRRGVIMVYDANGKNGVPFETWDPEADLFFDDSLYEGGTSMDPVERENRNKS